MTVTISETGTITANFTRTISNGTTTYALVSLSTSSLTVNSGLTIPFSVTARASSGLEDWFNPLAWSDDGVFGIAGAITQVGQLVGDALDHDVPGFFVDFPASVNSLEALGPTNRTLSTDVATASYDGSSFSISANLGLAYDVTIGDGAYISMDQDNVVLNSLTVSEAGTLLAGLYEFTIDTQVVNNGSLEIVPGPGGSAGNGLVNSGTLQVDGQFQLHGTVVNSGQVVVHTPFSFNSSAI